MDKPKKQTIAYLSTFPPRECGIATFCRDLISALSKTYSSVMDARVVAINPDPSSGFNYPKEVIFQINRDSQNDYLKAAELINKSPAISLAVIQHEFGIFGGLLGDYLLKFLEELKKPSVIIFHTILPNPENGRKNIVRMLADKSSQIVVMTDLSRQILLNEYGIPENKVTIIPHGIHPVIYSQSKNAKRKLRLPLSPILSTFGLLSRGKGVEYVLEALPGVIKKYPRLLYLVVGKTHPQIIQEEGESYRQFLEKKVRDLNLSGNVKFINQYLNLPALLDYLQATDIYIATSLDPDHAVSGTFSYAAGVGRPIVATAFAQARSELAADTGILVDFKNPAAYAGAITGLLDQPEQMEQMGKNNYFRTRRLIWPNISIAYAKLFSRFIPALSGSQIHLPAIKLDHLAKLTDNFGIFQFAELDTPNPTFGYTLDDNARALLAVLLCRAKTKLFLPLKLAKIYLNFIEYCFLPNGHFQNYFNQDRRPNTTANEKDNLEETNARALLALARTIYSKFLPKELREKARLLYEKRADAGIAFTSPRAMAVYIEALYVRNKSGQSAEEMGQIHFYCEKLLLQLKENSSGDWQWFEAYLTYSNSILSKALLLGFKASGRTEYFNAGKNSLDFLIKHTFLNGIYTPIGQKGWYQQSGQRAFFDQQPEDAATMVQTLRLMYAVSKQEIYKKLMNKAFNWFLGENVLGQFVYDAATGGCYDGLGETYINLNQGAESTILYLLARLTLETS